MKIIQKYFPNLDQSQLDKFSALHELYADWNGKVNLISRKDIDNLYERHILHSLAIAKEFKFKEGTEILDLGTGGGFPGIPLSIFFPEVRFHMIDGTLKKIKVVQNIIETLQLENATAQQVRAEELKKRKFDFIVTRAVAVLPQLKIWTQRLYKEKESNAVPNGLIALKGGDIKKEIKTLPKGEYTEVFPIRKMFEEEFFEEKYLIYLQA
jgi:16S rRNA (guanine527-N7)-methyltransferase